MCDIGLKTFRRTNGGSTVSITTVLTAIFATVSFTSVDAVVWEERRGVWLREGEKRSGGVRLWESEGRKGVRLRKGDVRT